MQKHREDGTDEFYMLDVGGQSGAVIDLTHTKGTRLGSSITGARAAGVGCSSRHV